MSFERVIKESFTRGMMFWFFWDAWKLEEKSLLSWKFLPKLANKLQGSQSAFFVTVFIIKSYIEKFMQLEQM